MRMPVPNRNGIAKIDVAILLVMGAIIAVVAVPRHARTSRAAQAEAAILQLEQAAGRVIREIAPEPAQDGEGPHLPSDADLVARLEQQLGGPVPPNPFTRERDVSIKRHVALEPCDCFDVTGGWVWNIVVPEEAWRPLQSSFWLNSDTVNVGKGKGEACIHP